MGGTGRLDCSPCRLSRHYICMYVHKQPPRLRRQSYTTYIMSCAFFWWPILTSALAAACKSGHKHGAPPSIAHMLLVSLRSSGVSPATENHI